MVQKRSLVQKKAPKKNPTKCLKLIFICSIYKQEMHGIFLFSRVAFPMMVSESPSSSESALLCTSELLSLFFDFSFVFFFSIRFCTTYTICT